MINRLQSLKTGNARQQQAYTALEQLKIMEHLKEFNPIVCGTLPIGIDTEESDVDIIMEVYHFDLFEEKVRTQYGNKKGFVFKHKVIRGVPVCKANFYVDHIEFELFGQPQPVKKQNAYLHMVIEYELMKEDPLLRESVVELKKQGYKTEPAFCEILGLKGDPYEAILQFGREKWKVKRMEKQVNKAIQLRENGDLKESNKLLLGLIENGMEDAFLNYQVAWSFDVLGEEAKAVPYYEKAIKLDLPMNEMQGALLGLGSTYRTLGEYEKSKQTFLKGIKEFPNNHALKTFYAMTLYNLKEYDKAIEFLLHSLLETTADKEILAYKRAILFYSDKLDKTWNE